MRKKKGGFLKFLLFVAVLGAAGYFGKQFYDDYKEKKDSSGEILSGDSSNNGETNNGSGQEVIEISNVDDLLELSGKTVNGNYKLTADIDLKDKEWEAITSFQGVLDGANHSIKNMSGKGLVATIKKSIVRNLKIENADVEYKGILAETIDECEIENVDVDGAVNIVVSRGEVGGMAGRIEDSVLGKINVDVDVDVKVETSYEINIGGLSGVFYYSEITNSTASGKVKAKNGSTVNVGGFIGRGNQSEIKTSSSSVEVSCLDAKTANVGGFAGAMVDSETKRIFSSGTVTCDGTNVVIGGLVGHFDYSSVKYYSVINNSYSSSDVVVEGGSSIKAGGLVGYGKYITLINNYSIGDVSIATDEQSTVNVGGVIASAVSSSSRTDFINNYSFSNIEAQIASGTITAGRFKSTAFGNSFNIGLILNNYYYEDSVFDLDAGTGSVVEADVGTSATKAQIIESVNLYWDPTAWNISSSDHPVLKSESVYEISAVEQLKNLQGKYISNDIALVEDIDLSGVEWSGFVLRNGSIDGRGHKISNLNMKTGGENVGFVSVARGSVFANLHLRSVSVVYESDDETEVHSVGGLAAEFRDGEIDNCSVEANFVIGKTYHVGGIGGLVGLTISEVKISRSYSFGKIDAYDDGYYGGLIGYMRAPGQVHNCYSSVNIKSIGIGDSISVGGLVGYVGEPSSSSVRYHIDSSYAAGNIDVKAQNKVYAGGLVADVYFMVNINSSYATGDITSETISDSSFNNYANVLVGTAIGTVENSYADIDQQINAIVGGSVKNVIKEKRVNIVDMNTILQFVKDNWDENIWQFYDDKNPTIK